MSPLVETLRSENASLTVSIRFMPASAFSHGQQKITYSVAVKLIVASSDTLLWAIDNVGFFLLGYVPFFSDVGVSPLSLQNCIWLFVDTVVLTFECERTVDYSDWVIVDKQM